ncbi:hypothetical protein [Tessaracoccus sp. G1721]
MQPRQFLNPGLEALIRAQSGVIATDQLIGGGLTATVVRRMSTNWEQPSPGIFLTTAPTWLAAAWAGLLRGGPTAALGAEAAAYLHKVVRDEPPALAVWAPSRRRDFTVGTWMVEFRRGHPTSMGTPPRTTVERSLIDLAGQATEDAAVAAVARALAQSKTTPERVLSELRSRERTRHSAVLTELCTQAGQGIESALEWRFSRQVLARHRLPPGERQVVDASTRMDVRYVAQQLVIELDGARDHTDWSKDMLRDNKRLLDDGALTLRYGWNAVVGQTCAVAAQVATALSSRGWEGRVRRCRRCPKD